MVRDVPHRVGADRHPARQRTNAALCVRRDVLRRANAERSCRAPDGRPSIGGRLHGTKPHAIIIEALRGLGKSRPEPSRATEQELLGFGDPTLRGPLEQVQLRRRQRGRRPIRRERDFSARTLVELDRGHATTARSYTRRRGKDPISCPARRAPGGNAENVRARSPRLARRKTEPCRRAGSCAAQLRYRIGRGRRAIPRQTERLPRLRGDPQVRAPSVAGDAGTPLAVATAALVARTTCTRRARSSALARRAGALAVAAPPLAVAAAGLGAAVAARAGRARCAGALAVAAPPLAVAAAGLGAAVTARVGRARRAGAFPSAGAVPTPGAICLALSRRAAAGAARLTLRLSRTARPLTAAAPPLAVAAAGLGAAVAARAGRARCAGALLVAASPLAAAAAKLRAAVATSAGRTRRAGALPTTRTRSAPAAIRLALSRHESAVPAGIVFRLARVACSGFDALPPLAVAVADLGSIAAGRARVRLTYPFVRTLT